MQLVFTYRLKMDETEEHAVADLPETVEALFQALVRLGHSVEKLEVSGPASRVVARLESLRPDLIFNTAIGKHEKAPEAYYPSLFQHLGFGFTGSDSWTSTITSDKRMSKLFLAENGIATPRFCFVDRLPLPDDFELRFPVIVKPNFEGASKGIYEDSVIESFGELVARLPEMLGQYPTGLLIEEFIVGKDIVVPFLENAPGLDPKGSPGILAPCGYRFAADVIANRKYLFYDYSLQHELRNAVTVEVPADIAGDVSEKARSMTARIVALLGMKDFGRIDYRLSEDGQLYFIEANPLPSLESGASILAAAQAIGLHSLDAVLQVMLKSACSRYRIDPRSGIPRAKRKLTVGLTYNMKRIKAKSAEDDDSEAEFDSLSTISAISEAIASHGHEVIPIEATSELPAIISNMKLDLVFNVAEGLQGRSREAQIPAILELVGIPYVGSDPATLAVCLDKTLAKKMVRAAGIATPDFVLMKTGNEHLPKSMKFPMIVKPYAEGSSKGVMGVNVVETEQQLRENAKALIARYRQPVLVENYLCGREFTVGLLGEYRPRVLPPMEIVFHAAPGAHPVYAFDHKLAFNDQVSYDVPAKIDPALANRIGQAARGAFRALGCRDVARIDLRLDERGKVHFIECNPLPGLTPKWSDLCLIGEAAGMDYRSLIGEIMAPALRRMRASFR